MLNRVIRPHPLLQHNLKIVGILIREMFFFFLQHSIFIFVLFKSMFDNEASLHFYLFKYSLILFISAFCLIS